MPPLRGVQTVHSSMTDVKTNIQEEDLKAQQRIRHLTAFLIVALMLLVSVTVLFTNLRRDYNQQAGQLAQLEQQLQQARDKTQQAELRATEAEDLASQAEARATEAESMLQAKYDEGYAAGQQEGYSNGQQEGYDEGYTAGYAKGAASHSTSSSWSSGSGSSYSTTTQSGSTSTMTVYITKTGSKYHRSGCQYLARSCYSISLSEARARGYSACSRCW